jgi:hypothetical protein
MSKIASTKCDKCGNLIEDGTGGELVFTTKTNRQTADLHQTCADGLGVDFKTQKKRGRKPKEPVTVV